MTSEKPGTDPLEGLSDAARHGIALNILQGFEPTQEFIDLMRLLDSGEIDVEEALRRVETMALRD